MGKVTYPQDFQEKYGGNHLMMMMIMMIMMIMIMMLILMKTVCFFVHWEWIKNTSRMR
jgi:uncharacterized membrane protein